MKDAKGHGSDQRGGAADQPSQARMPARHSFTKRKHDQRSGSGGGSGGSSGSGGGGGGMHPKSGAHTTGIHKQTRMNLAQLSAAGTNPSIPPPIIGGRK
jgi:hypothetical protein